MANDSSRLESIGDDEPDAGSVAGQTRRLLERARSLGDVPPEGEALLAWLAAPGPGSAPGVSRWLTQVWRDRADLQEAFPGIFLDPAQRDGFLEWARAFAVAEYGAPAALQPGDTAPADVATPDEADDAPLEHGLTVVGFLGLILGLGAAGRAMARAARLGGVRTRTLSWDLSSSELRVPWRDDLDEHVRGPGLDTLLLCVNGAQTALLSRALGPRHTAGRRRIGLWFWEADRLPDDHAAGFDHLDEVWVASEFVAEAVRRAAPTGFPVRVVPLGLDLPAPEVVEASQRVTRRELVLPPEGLLVGLAFDFNSRIIRKNPIGLIEAFTSAFPEPFPLGADRGPYLVLKSINATEHPTDAGAVRAAVGERPDILLIDRAWDDAHRLAFTRELDVVASLHRSEGYGYALLEAMALGKPTIATSWSGNLAFMDDDTAWLVPAAQVPVPEGDAIYPAGAHWAEPDLDAAARALCQVVIGLDDPDSADGREVRRRTDAARARTGSIADGTLAAAWIRDAVDERSRG